MTLRVQILSDVHLEFHHWDNGESFIRSLNPDGVDVLILAGDVGTSHTVVNSLRMFCDHFAQAKVVFLLGNHEFYGSNPNDVINSIRKVASELKNLVFLNRDIVDINGIKFAGTTLWFRDDPLNAVYKSHLNDFYQIRGFTPWVYEENERDIRFLRKAAPQADVVITHHLPSEQSIASRWKGSPYNRFFVCPVDDIIESAQPILWIYGHTHEVADFTIGRTRLIANPCGYPHEDNVGFQARLIVEVNPKG